MISFTPAYYWSKKDRCKQCNKEYLWENNRWYSGLCLECNKLNDIKS